MKIIVQKYGGSSVATKEKLEIVVNKIIQCSKKNKKLIIVVSAQGKETDSLIKTAKNYSNNPDKRSLDLLLSTGELRTVSLLSMMLNDKGYKSIGLTGEQAGILSNSDYGNAKIDSIYTDNILNYLKENYIVIVAGFQATDKLGNITTLGRGGSDLTAVALACYLKAEKCEIYTDVDGIFSADPKTITKARLLENISYDKMLEASSSGTKVLHDKCVTMAKNYNLKVYVRNTNKDNLGSIVSNIDINNNYVSFISSLDNISIITIVGNISEKNKEILNIISNIAKKEKYTLHTKTISKYSIKISVNTDICIEFIKKLHNKLIENNIENSIKKS